MQSKIAHAAERKAFSVVVDQLMKATSGDDRQKKLDGAIDVAEKLLKYTVPGAVKTMRKALYPGSKWENWFFDLIDKTDPHVLKTAIMNGGYEGAFRGYRTTQEVAQERGHNVPWIILFDPTSACNKHCVGCWAADYGNRLNLTYDECDRLITEAKAMGTHMFMLTGGEPLVRKKDVLKLAEKHDDCLFNIFTNASLVDEEFCQKVQELGNIIFSVSLESYEPTVNDGRRGEGSFEEVMRAFDLMQKHGLLYGTSTAYTRANTERVSSDQFFELLVQKGCRWAWYFHYMPVGEGANADLMPTPEQREYMFHRIREVRGFEGGFPIFAMDFQNDGEFVGGCIAGGRIYCHVNARGDVEPCVFIHYSNANIHDMSWEDCLKQPMFQQYRKNYPWNNNQLQPCPMLENPAVLPRMVDAAGAKSTEYVTPESADDLCKRTTPYAKAWAPTAKKLWLEEHPTGKKEFNDGVNNVSVAERVANMEKADEEDANVLD
ncbi:MAG: radical SAM protein [Atopobiaceae bacterium]